MPDTNKNDRLDPKTEAMKVLREDLIGSNDWKQSKFGYLTGYTAGKRAVGSIGTNIGESTSRIGGMIRGLFPASDNLPSLPEGGEAAERFEKSMQLHGVDSDGLSVIQLNTYRATLLYVGLGLVFVIAVAISLVSYPGGSPFANVVRFGPFPLIIALIYKHAYTNWIVRHRKLMGPIAFLLSGDYMPKK